MNCPKCNGTEIRVSRHAKAMDVFYRTRGQEAYRCRKCRHRFYDVRSAVAKNAASTPSGDKTKSRQSSRSGRSSFWRVSSRQRKRIWQRVTLLAIFAAAFLIFWFFLRYITTERIPSEGTPTGFMLGQSVDQVV